MKEFDNLYEENKKIDSIYDELYNNSDKTIIEKNIVELLVELGELANETRCFKYWSVKKPSEKAIILDEYADCLLMGLYFSNMVNISLDEEFNEIEIKDAVEQFKILFKLVSNLDYELDRDSIKDILANIRNLGYLLGFNNQDIIDGCLLKIEKIKVRLQTNY